MANNVSSFLLLIVLLNILHGISSIPNIVLSKTIKIGCVFLALNILLTMIARNVADTREIVPYTVMLSKLAIAIIAHGLWKNFRR